MLRNQQVSGSSPLTSSTQTRMNTGFVRVILLPLRPLSLILVVIWSLLLQKHTKEYPQIRERAAGCSPCFPLVYSAVDIYGLVEPVDQSQQARAVYIAKNAKNQTLVCNLVEFIHLCPPPSAGRKAFLLPSLDQCPFGACAGPA